jgi:hypothetical protein
MIHNRIRLFCLTALALGAAYAASPYEVTLLTNVTANGTQLKAGSYQLEIQEGKAVFKQGGKVIAIPATLIKSEASFPSTIFLSQRSKLMEIDLGGTQDRVVFAETAAKK